MGYNGKPHNNKNNQKVYRGKNVSPTSGPLQMRNYAIKLIKNMAYGEFHYDKDGPLFQNKEFLFTAFNMAKEKVYEQEVYVKSLEYAYGCTDDPVIIKMRNKHKRGYDAWNYIYNTLGCMMQTADFGLILGMMNRLPDYKYDL